MGNTVNRIIPYPELTDVANVPADMRELAEAVDTVFGADSGWVNVTISAGFAAAAGAAPQVRKIGSVVYARGGWASTGISAAATYAVGTIPSGYRPGLDVVGQAGTDKGTAVAALFVAPGGGVSLRTNGVASTLFYFGGQSWLIN